MTPTETQGSGLSRLNSPMGALMNWTGLAAAALLLGAGCNSASSPTVGTNTPGTVVQDPDTGQYFIVDPSKGGLAAEIRVTRVGWGRLVDVFGLNTGDGNKRVLMAENFAMTPNLLTDGVDFLLETNPVTAEQTLTILRDVGDGTGLPPTHPFFDRLKAAEANIEPVFDNGLAGAGFFSMVPRNSVLMVQFDDLIDASTLDSTTLRMVTGTPSVIPYEARVMIDRSHGDLADHNQAVPGLEFYTTRVLVDMTVSELESFETNPPLPVNTVGLPPSVNSNLSNAQVRIPTKIVPLLGQDQVLSNPTGHGLTTANNGSIDWASQTLDVARAFRSGGPEEVTADPYNGFLRDEDAPRVVGVQNGSIKLGITVIDAANNEFLIEEFHFESDFCSQTPAIGDIIEQPGVFAEVIAIPSPVQNKIVSDLAVRLISFPDDWPNGSQTWVNTGLGPAQFLAPFDLVLDGAKAACFITVSPQPEGYPEQPTTGVLNSANFTLRFNEPMDPEGMNAFDAITITRNAIPQGNFDYIVGTLASSIDLHEFRFLPDLPLDHDANGAEDYFLNLVAGASGTADLAGNGLYDTFPQVQLTIDPSAPPSNNGGRVSFFSSPDEEYPVGSEIGDGELGTLAEWAGQHQFDLQRGIIRPRPVTRFQATVDRANNQILGAMTSNPLGQQAPVSKYGSKTQMLWRYLDLGLGLIKQDVLTGAWIIDETHYNIDVEGLSWSPMGGAVVVDNYSRFEIRLSHTGFFPDETPPPTGYFPASGLVDLYEGNFLSVANDPQRIVHEDFRGYSINPGDVYVANQNMKLIPFPMNSQVAPDKYRHYTYRDTGIRTRGGPDGTGVPPVHYYQVTGEAFPCLPSGNPPVCTPCLYNPLYYPDNVQSVALPLLLEFRCWQEDKANGLNRFDTSTVHGNVPAGPWFRAHSTGGIDQATEPQFVDPALEDRATGGYDPNSVPSGAPTPGTDAEMYMGSADFVVRVSRSHSIWFGAIDPSAPQTNFTVPSYNPPTVVPGPLDQPIGTSVSFDFRGATSITPGMDFDPDDADGINTHDALYMADTLDLYGDHYLEPPSTCDGSFSHNNDTTLNSGIGFKNGVSAWSPNVSDVNGSQYYQVRLTWISNPDTGLTAELSSFAMTWFQ
jgi:hypothetical protein